MSIISLEEFIKKISLCFCDECKKYDNVVWKGGYVSENEAKKALASISLREKYGIIVSHECDSNTLKLRNITKWNAIVDAWLSDNINSNLETELTNFEIKTYLLPRRLDFQRNHPYK